MWKCVGVSVGLVYLLVSGCDAKESAAQTRGDKILSSLSDFERQVLSDKKVTRAEEQRALQIYSQCVRDAGMSVTVNSRNDRIGLSCLSVGSEGATEEVSSKMDDVISQCTNRVDAVDAVWALQNAPTKDEVKLAEANLRKCVVHAGVTVEETAGIDAVFGAVTETLQRSRERGQMPPDPGAMAVRECAQAYTDVAGKVPLPGLEDALRKLK